MLAMTALALMATTKVVVVPLSTKIAMCVAGGIGTVAGCALIYIKENKSN
jgi:hypothetical protein